jgi:hypothetical protein
MAIPRHFCLLIGNRFWPSGALAPEAGKCAFPWADSDKSGARKSNGFFGCGARPQPEKAAAGGLRVTEQGCERRTWALPDVSGGGERYDRFGVVVGEGVVEPRIEGRFARRVGAGMHPLLPEPEMAHDALR